MYRSKNSLNSLNHFKRSVKFITQTDWQKIIRIVLLLLFGWMFNFSVNSGSVEKTLQEGNLPTKIRQQQLIAQGGLKAACSYSDFTGF